MDGVASSTTTHLLSGGDGLRSISGIIARSECGFYLGRPVRRQSLAGSLRRRQAFVASSKDTRLRS